MADGRGEWGRALLKLEEHCNRQQMGSALQEVSNEKFNDSQPGSFISRSILSR
jgi:hypothetical protein